MAEKVFNIYKGQRDFTGITVGCLLLKDHAALANITGDEDDIAEILAITNVTECDFTNYLRDITLTEAETINDTNDRAEWDVEDVVFSSAGGAANNDVGAAIFYDEGGGTDATRIPISFHDTNFPITTNGGDLTIAVADVVRTT